MNSEILNILSSPYAVWAAISAGALINAIAIFVISRRLHERNRAQERVIRQLGNEIKLIFSASSEMEHRIDELNKCLTAVSQRQDQQTLQEPTQQAYRHAINLMRSGVQLDEVVEKSGLSRGELELLKLLNKSDVTEVA